MRVLILSCNTGGGHNACAGAIKEVFDAEGETCVIADALRFVSERISRTVAAGHIFLYRRLPWVFNAGYGFAERHPACFGKSSWLYGFFAGGCDGLRQAVADGGYDTVICTHPFAALMLTEAQQRYRMPVKTAFVATDYTCCPSVKESRLDRYFIPSIRLRSEFLCENIPEDRMIPSGIPIGQKFYSTAEMAAAKERLGIAPSQKHVVMACGSMGCGPMERLAACLAEDMGEDAVLTVVCGSNKGMQARLEKKCAGRKNLRICGYVQDMAALLDGTDIYLTKAGGISVTEGATKKLPMVLIPAVAGCEDYNSAFYQRLGGAVSGRGVRALSGCCLSLLADAERCGRLSGALAEEGMQNAALCIYTTLKDL